MAGIYFHIPFCKQACHYCDFHFSTNTDIRPSLLEAMCDELRLQKEYLSGRSIETIYFGGGTPSMLSANEIASLLETARNQFTILPEAEITLEANPDDLNHVKLLALKETGVNRLSIGIQSFNDKLLTFMNRAHNSGAAVESIQQAKACGFDNISIDLIYGIPGLTNDMWQNDIRHAIDLSPAHISAYSLTIEPRTAFGHWAAKGRLVTVNDDAAATQLEMLVSVLQRAGYEQYEVSNFCKPGMESRHNSSYWKQEPYLGIGPSAHSYNLATRQHNVANNYQYVRALQSGKVPFELETLSFADRTNEYLLTTLRTKWGSDIERLKKEFKYDIVALHKPLLDQLSNQGLIIAEGNILKLTTQGKLLADKITSELFLAS